MELGSNNGYFALKREVTEGTAVTPDVYVPLYEESMATEFNVNSDTSIFGNKFGSIAMNVGRVGCAMSRVA